MVENPQALLEYSLSEINRSLIDILPINVFLSNKEGYTIWANQRMLTTLGLASLQDFVGVHISRWGDQPWQCCQETMLTGKETAIEEKGENGCYYFTTRKPIIRNNEIQGVLGVSLDITDRKKAEIAKTQFLENITHDLRTPLSGIVGVTHLMKETAEDPDDRNYTLYADMLVKASNSLYKLLDQIIESVHLTTGERLIAHQTFSLKSLLEEIIELHQPTAAQKQLSLSWEYDATLPPQLVGDPLRIKMIILELLTNALKYTAQGSVKLSSQLAAQEGPCIQLKLSVEDTGIGIPTDQYQEIFNKFTRLTQSHQGIYKGMGLGLANIQQLIQDLKGEIKVDSTLGSGSTFTCTLPLQLPSD
jgi:two-component system aerobic respiration control sensor histidine kinase ArcB